MVRRLERMSRGASALARFRHERARARKPHGSLEARAAYDLPFAVGRPVEDGSSTGGKPRPSVQIERGKIHWRILSAQVLFHPPPCPVGAHRPALDRASAAPFRIERKAQNPTEPVNGTICGLCRPRCR